MASDEMQADAIRMRRSLRAANLPSDFGTALAQLARDYVRDDKHLTEILADTPPEMKRDVYESLRPNLKFTAKPLDWYETQAKEQAEREKLPILGPDGRLLEFRPAQDISSVEKRAQEILDEAVAEKTLILRCKKCTALEKFFGLEHESRIDVIKKARRKGWVYDSTGKIPAEICPNCETSLRAAHEAHYGRAHA